MVCFGEVKASFKLLIFISSAVDYHLAFRIKIYIYCIYFFLGKWSQVQFSKWPQGQVAMYEFPQWKTNFLLWRENSIIPICA